MADTPNYSNSPLVNLSNAGGGVDYTKSPLANSEVLNSLVSREAPKKEKTTEELEAELRARRAAVQGRTANDIIGDAVISAASGATGLVGAIASIGTTGVGKGVQALTEEGSLANDIGGAISEYGRDLAVGTQDTGEMFNELKSNERQQTAELTGQISQIQSQRSAEQEAQDVANGDSEFIASLSRVGRDALNYGELVLSDSSETGDLVANALGSLPVSAKIAGAAGALVTPTKDAALIANAIAPTATTRLLAAGTTAAERGAIAAGVGLTEASSVYQSTVAEVMGRTHEDLLANSQQYVELLAQGMTPDEAKNQLADEAGIEAFGLQFPTAMAAGVLAARFNANPIGAFEGKNLVEGLREVGVQALEEGIQGGSGQLNQNIAIQNTVDRSQTLAEGVGDQIAGGVIGGAGMAGVIGGPSMVVDAGQVIADNAGKTLQAGGEILTRGTGAVVRGATDAVNTALESPLGRSTADTLRRYAEGGTEAVTNAVVSGVGSVVETLNPVIDQVREMTRNGVIPAAEQAMQRVKNYAESSNLGTQAESVVASVTAAIWSKKTIAETQDPASVPEAVRSVVETPETGPVPEAFASSVVQGGSLLDTVTGVLQTLTKDDVSVSQMSESAVAFAAEKFTKLQAATTELPAQIQNQVKKVLASPDFKRIQTRLSRINLNESLTPDAEITPDVVATTVAVAKLNPGNVNPDVVDRILEQNDTPVSDDQVVLLKAASSIARTINNRVGREVEISREKVISLQAKPGASTEVKSQDKISRSIQVSGLPGLRSVNDFASDIFKGNQAPNQKVVGKDGISVPVKAVADQFKMFVQHMNNKVEALNQSYDQNNERGRGPSIGFTSLVNGREMRTPDMAGSAKPVAYHRESEKSVEFAKIVHADAVAAAEVYNTLVETFPELFPEGKVQIPTLRGLEETTQENQAETPVEAETAPIAEEQQTDTQTNTTAVEGEVSPRETSTEPQEQDLLAIVSAYEEDVNSVPMDPETKAVVMEKASMILEAIGMDTSLIAELATLQLPEGDTLKGMAYWKEKVISLAPELTNDMEQDLSLHVLIHEIMHLVDFVAGKEERLASDRDGMFDIVDGPAYLEIEAATKADPEWEKFFSYANSQNDPKTHASELFAELASVVVSNPEIAQQLFPKGTAYVQKVIAQAGGNFELGTSARDAAREETPARDGDGEQQAVVQPQENQGVSEEFQEVFLEGSKKVPYSNATEIFDLVSQKEGSEAYLDFAKPLVAKLVSGMQNRLEQIQSKMSESDKAEGTKLVRFKTMMLIDPTTGRYNERLVELAAVAVVDWLSSARGMGAGRLDDTLEELGLTAFDLNKADILGIINSVPVRQTAETVAKDVLRMWNVRPNVDASMVDIRGVSEGVVKELLTVLNDTTDLINLIEIKVSVDKEGAEKATATSIEVTGMRETQKLLGVSGQSMVQKTLNPELSIMASIGEKIVGTDQTQSRGNVPLTDLEKAALKRMQDTPHYLSEGVSTFVQALGFDNLKTLLGWKNPGNLADNHPLRVSIEGKNASIERDYEDAFQIVNAVGNGETPVYYPVGISKVGRHQMKGINPQNNKILRALVTPTHSTLDMTKQDHQNAFWLTVAQASGLAKVENKNHNEILSSIQQDFAAKYGEAVALIETYLESGTLDGEALVKALGSAEMAQLNAVFAVASLNQAKKAGTLESFETSLSFELDGKTDGPGNMMSNFGQGELTSDDYTNFQRVGYFLGQKFMTLNRFFGQPNSDGSKNIDLYEITSNKSDKRFYSTIRNAPAAEKARLYAIQRFAGVFGDFKILEDGSIVMTRNTSKNPMTKTVYGSGVKGVGEGIAQDMMLGFYEALMDLPDGTDLATHFAYPNIEEDIEILFGQKLPAKLDKNTFMFSKNSESKFSETVTDTVGTILSETAKSVIGDKITEVNDLLVFITGVQTQFIQQLYQKKLDELVEKRAAEGKISRNKQGKGVLRELSERDYQDLVAELLAYAPVYSNGSQTLSIGSFSGSASDIEMSMTMDSRLRVKSTLAKPDLAGVKVIPYISIGRGDAMMMNTIYGSENAPSDTIPVFDGIDMPISKIITYANQINEAVSKNWDANVLGDVLADFERFLGSVGADQDLLDLAMAKVSKTSFKSSVVQRKLNTPEQLLETLKEAVRQNQARKSVFKRIPLSVDHMGGSNTSFVRNENGPELDLNQINQMISAELDGTRLEMLEETQIEAPAPQETGDIGLAPKEPVKPSKDGFNQMIQMETRELMKALLRETRDKNVRETVRVLMDILPDPGQVVVGNSKALQNFFEEQGVKFEDRKGIYDVDNNTIYLTDNNHETLTHELVHMATFLKVLAHYEGTETNEAVVRLEGLMAEFMDLDMSQEAQEVQDAANKAKAQIFQAQASEDAFSKAKALNEFMAWTLSNEALIKKLKATPTKTTQTLTKKVIAWMKRLLGNVPSDIYSNILFNTQILGGGNIDEDQGFFDFSGNGNGNGGGTGGNNNNNGGVTPPAANYTNFWIDRIRDVLEQSTKGTNPKYSQAKVIRYIQAAEDAVDKLSFGGFTMTDYQRKTFMAIHAVLATEMRLDTQSLLAMGNLYDHITNNLSPGMFGTGQAAQDKYSTVMELMGATKNDEGVSDAIAVLLALSQTSTSFRSALDQIPSPQGPEGVSVASLNDLLTSLTGFMMRKAVGTIDMSDKSVTEVLDGLSGSILNQDQEEEFRMLKRLMSSMDAADKYVGGALSKLAQTAHRMNVELQQSTRSGLTKTIGGSIALATTFLDKNLSEAGEKGLSDLVHMGGRLDWFVPFREFIAEVINTNKTNEEVVMLLDQVQFAVQASRQAYREELPVILQNEFQTSPTSEQWKASHMVLGKTDIASIFDLRNPDDAMSLLSDQARLNRKIAEKERAIRRNYPQVQADLIIEKAQQLADFMNGKGAGFQLWKNAYAIHKLSGGGNDTMVVEIDRLVTLYAINGTEQDQRQMVADMHDADPVAVHNLIVYMQGLNKEEDQKDITEAARLNGYKGYIPDFGSNDVTLVIEDDAYAETMKRRGFIRVADYTAENGFSAVSRGYYVSSVKQMGNYSQGVLQQVQDTYRGVNATTGLTANGSVSGVIAGTEVTTVTDELNRVQSVADPKEVLIPVYDETGILYYERAVNPDLFNQFQEPESNLALMLGAWAGRQVEEKFAQTYNNLLIDRLKENWDNRLTGEDDLFIDMSDPNLEDPIYRDSWKVIPPQTKSYILEVFGEDGGFMVRRSMINLALGYRDPSITDVWSGKTRLPEGARDAIKAVSKLLMGDKAMTILGKAEEITQATVSQAKDLIVVRSLVVPYMNTQSNVLQLVNNGVPMKGIIKGYKSKFAEIDQYNENTKQIKALSARIQLAVNDPNRVAILEQQRQVLYDENARMSISPLVEAGLYKNISEGITELDVDLTKGRLADWIEAKVNKLPGGVKTIVKYGLISKDTALYRGANKAVQYGDFIGRSILFDHLVARGMSQKDALVQVNRAFVNFSLLPGRMRTGLESMGLTWFLTFKIQSMKVAAQMLRDNPVRSLLVAQADTGPVTDNLIPKVIEGDISYSLGLEMLFDSVTMNPWVDLMNK